MKMIFTEGNGGNEAMKLLLSIFVLFVSFCSNAAILIGNGLVGTTGNGLYAPMSLIPQSNPLILSNGNIAFGVNYTLALANGGFTNTVVAGNYTLRQGPYAVTLTVPDTTNTLYLTNLFTGGLYSNYVYNAAPSVYGTKVDSNDLAAGFLFTKLISTPYVTWTPTNEGGNEGLVLTVTGSQGSGVAVYPGHNEGPYVTNAGVVQVNGSNTLAGLSSVNTTNTYTGTLIVTNGQTNLALTAGEIIGTDANDGFVSLSYAAITNGVNSALLAQMGVLSTNSTNNVTATNNALLADLSATNTILRNALEPTNANLAWWGLWTNLYVTNGSGSVMALALITNNSGNGLILSNYFTSGSGAMPGNFNMAGFYLQNLIATNGSTNYQVLLVTNGALIASNSAGYFWTSNGVSSNTGPLAVLGAFTTANAQLGGFTLTGTSLGTNSTGYALADLNQLAVQGTATTNNFQWGALQTSNFWAKFNGVLVTNVGSGSLVATHLITNAVYVAGQTWLVVSNDLSGSGGGGGSGESLTNVTVIFSNAPTIWTNPGASISFSGSNYITGQATNGASLVLDTNFDLFLGGAGGSFGVTNGAATALSLATPGWVFTGAQHGIIAYCGSNHYQWATNIQFTGNGSGSYYCFTNTNFFTMDSGTVKLAISQAGSDSSGLYMGVNYGGYFSGNVGGTPTWETSGQWVQGNANGFTTEYPVAIADGFYIYFASTSSHSANVNIVVDVLMSGTNVSIPLNAGL
jgi:hypothetical protein